MASFNKFNNFTKALGDKLHNLGTDTFFVQLMNSTPSASNSVETDLPADLSTANGYTSGGVTLGTGTWSTSSGTAKLTITDKVITASGGTIGPFRYVVVLNNTAAFISGRRIQVPQGIYAVTGMSNGLTEAHRLATSVGALSYSVNPASLTFGRKITGITGGYAETGNTTTLKTARKISIVAASFSENGSNSTLQLGHKTNVSTTDFAEIAQSGLLRIGRKSNPITEAYILTADQVNLVIARKISVIRSTYVLVGDSALLHLIKRINTQVTAFGTTFYSAGLTYVPASYPEFASRSLISDEFFTKSVIFSDYVSKSKV